MNNKVDKSQKICCYCNEPFIPKEGNYIKVGNRYAHTGCYNRYVQNGRKPLKDAKKYICPYCSEEVDAKEGIPVMYNRYCHSECYDKYHTEDDENIQKIYETLNKYHIPYEYFKCETQRRAMITKGLTNKGINKTLDYFYGIKHGDKSKARGGIGIVPYIYDEAEKWYKKQAQIHQTAEKSLEKIDEEEIIVTRLSTPNKIKNFYDINDFI